MAEKEDTQSGLEAARKEIERSYDEYPYESNPFPLTHPGHLYVMGRLFGLQPAEPTNCRVLELGSASGGNLIPMALQLPESQFFGVDLSSKQVEVGKQLISKLKLKNIKLEHKDIMKVGGRIRKFDYIICHGVFSWVPPEVQDKILAICDQYLNENGIAYISYNTYPGWHMRESIRNMMRYHSQQFDDMQNKVNQSRALLNFLAQAETQGNVFAQYLKNEAQSLANVTDSYIAHEHLEGDNQPMYFHEFAQMADDHGLQYLGEAEFSTMLASNFPQQVVETLQRVGKDVVQQEQYMDFLRNRMFRSTLMCKKELELVRRVDAKKIQEFRISSPARTKEAQPDIKSKETVEFLGLNNIRMGTNSPLSKTALWHLGQRWPLSYSFAELASACAQTLGAEVKQIEGQLAIDMIQAYTKGAIKLSHLADRATLEITDKPEASLLARTMAEESPFVTNLNHQRVRLNEPLRQLVKLLNGKNGSEQLATVLCGLVKDGALQVRHEGQLMQNEAQIKANVEQFLPRMLQELAKLAVIVDK